MKILLIQPNNTLFKDGEGWAQKNKRYAYAPTTLTLLAALIPPELKAEVQIIDEGVQVLPENFQADLVGISICTPNAPRAYGIAQKAKERGMTVVMGGYHTTLMPEEAMQHADAIVVGYAERAWPKLLQDYQKGQLQKVYQEPMEDIFESVQMPFPRRELLKPKAYMARNTLEATRGCPNQCNFCVIAAAFGKQVYRRPISEVVKEIQAMNTKRVVFLDSSPTENVAYCKELYQALIPLKIRWYGSITMRAAVDNDWFKLAAQSGCQGVLVGFESINQDSLQLHKKGFSQVEDYKRSIKKLHQAGIAILGCFVFGLDGDDRSIFERTAEFVDQTKIDLVQYAVYTPFPGTSVFRELDKAGRILSKDWSLYNGKNVIFKPSHMSVDELQNGFYWAYKKTYTMRSVCKRVFGANPRAAIALYLLVSNMMFKYLGKAFVPKGIKAKHPPMALPSGD